MDIPESYIIRDLRTLKEFKGITICGYKRRDVINAYQNAMINNKLEDSIRWCVELHSTGLNNIIWNSLETLYIKYIHINHPKYFLYYLKRKKDYESIIQEYPKKHEIFTRNNQEIRNLYAELTSLSCILKKTNLFLGRSLPTINGKSFENNDIKKRMISKNLNKIHNFIYNDTSNEIRLALNEIINNLLSKNGTFQNCIYWYLWLEKAQNLNKKKEKILNNNEKHWIFILWKIIIHFEDHVCKNNSIYLKKIESCYKHNFKLGQISKKKYYIFIAFYTIKHELHFSKNIFKKEYLIIQTNANINKMYQNIIYNIEKHLTVDNKHNLYKEYNKLLYKIENNEKIIPKKIIPKKIINTDLHNEINKVMFSNYPEYDYLKKKNYQNNELNIYDENDYEKENEYEEENKYNEYDEYDEDNQDNIIYKNMTKKDILENIEYKQNKKLSAFTQFITYKKPVPQKKRYGNNDNEEYNQNENENENENEEYNDNEEDNENEEKNENKNLKNIIYKKK
jgi:hypothetical protein